MVITRYANVLVGLLLAVGLNAHGAQQPASVTPQPRVQEYEWMSIERWQQMHAEDVAIAEEGNVELLLIGDSITEGWPDSVLDEYFADYRVANFGIGGDRTENILWRLDNGSVGDLQPQVVSLLIGVNNFGLRGDSAQEVFMGVEATVEKLLQAFPQAQVVLHAIFPYQESADHPDRDRLKRANDAIATLARQDRVVLLDIGDELVEEDGDISADIMPDYLHLSDEGYRIWAENLRPVVSQWLDEAPANQ